MTTPVRSFAGSQELDVSATAICSARCELTGAGLVVVSEELRPELATPVLELHCAEEWTHITSFSPGATDHVVGLLPPGRYLLFGADDNGVMCTLAEKRGRARGVGVLTDLVEAASDGDVAAAEYVRRFAFTVREGVDCVLLDEEW